jgi:hypothetical protein
MDIIYYCRLVIWTAFRHSASMAQAILFFILVIIGAAIWLLPIFGMTVNSSALLSIFAVPQFYAILFGSIVIVRLICAPYWVWKAERIKIIELEAKLRTPENEIERRDALEIFAREHFDNVYASISKCLLSINDKTPWDGYKSGKIITQEKANKMLATKPSIKLSRTQTLAESQDKFVCLLSDYADEAMSLHDFPKLGSPELINFDEYIQWRHDDKEFVENLRSFVARPGYAILHEEIPMKWGAEVRETDWPKI